jgi:hypothetical protein
VLLREFVVRLCIVRAHAQNNRPFLLEFFPVIPKRTGFPGATRRIIPGVKTENCINPIKSPTGEPGFVRKTGSKMGPFYKIVANWKFDPKSGVNRSIQQSRQLVSQGPAQSENSIFMERGSTGH